MKTQGKGLLEAHKKNGFNCTLRSLWFALLLGLGWWSSWQNTLASPLLSYISSPYKGLSAADLEAKVWLSELESLPDLEPVVVKKIQEDPFSADGHYLLAQLYLRQFKQNPTQLRYLKQASELGQQAMDLAPASDRGFIIAAQVLDLMGYTENAVDILEGDGKVSLKKSWRVKFLKAQLLSGVRPDSELLSLYESALIEENTSRDIVVPYIIASLQMSHKGSDLVEALEAKRKLYPHKLFELSLAIAYTEAARYSDAHQIYGRLIVNYPELKEAYINDAIILYTQFNKHSEAETLLKEVIAQKNLSLAKKTLSMAHLGRISLEKNRAPEESKQLFLQAIRTAQSPLEWVSFTQKAYQNKNKMEDFVVILKELRDDYPSTSYLYALQGEVLSEQLMKHADALASFSEAILLDPERSEYYNGLGLAYYRMKNMDKALTTFSYAIQLDPQDASAHYNEACVLAIMGREKEALGSLKKALSLDPKLQQTAKADKDFDRIRDNVQFTQLIMSFASASSVRP